MELYIGGYAQGKTAYVKGKYPEALEYKPEQAEDNLQDKILIWNGFHKAVREMLAQGLHKEEILSKVWELSGKCKRLLIISDEIGNGIVPMEREERNWREQTGRILCEIAKEATRVERIQCGIPQIIK